MPTDPVLARRLNPESPTDRVSRRQVLKVSAGGAAALAFAGNRIRPTSAQGYQGELVIVSVQEVEQAAPTIAAIEAANPGVTVTWRFIPSERFTELFTAAEVAGDQIDIMDLNGQDLRRYALGERLQDLSGLTYLDRFLPVARETYTIQEKLWALPRGGVSGFTFFCNLKALRGDRGRRTARDLRRPRRDGPGPQGRRLRALRPCRQEHLPLADLAVLGVWPDLGQQRDRRHFQRPGRGHQVHRSRACRRLEILKRFTDDGLFIDGVNSLDSDAAWLQFTQGKAAFFYTHASTIGTYRQGDFPDLDMSLIPPVLAVDDPDIIRQLPGGTGSALGRYAEIADERAELAASVMDLMTSDEQVKALNDLNGDPVSCNANVVASDDPLALMYAEQCSPNQTTYLDWFWPPEITRAFQENQQAIVAGDSSPEDAADNIQSVLEDLYADDYEFVGVGDVRVCLDRTQTLAQERAGAGRPGAFGGRGDRQRWRGGGASYLWVLPAVALYGLFTSCRSSPGSGWRCSAGMGSKTPSSSVSTTSSGCSGMNGSGRPWVTTCNTRSGRSPAKS